MTQLRLHRLRNVDIKWAIAMGACLIAAAVAGGFAGDVAAVQHTANHANATAGNAQAQARENARLTQENAALTVATAELTQRVSQLADRLAADEHATCIIQSRGLSAQIYLTGSLRSLHRLLTFPPTRAQRRAERQISPRRLRAELTTYAALNYNLAKYGQIERQQPKRRTC